MELSQRPPAAYNLMLYMLSSHVLGASWYLLSIERHATCWKSACSKDDPDNDTFFDYGLFANAMSRNVVSSPFLEKYFYCLWFGLHNLSSYGEGLPATTFIGETVFSILVSIMGLALLANFIGNKQTYLQSTTVRLEEWRLKGRDTEEWMKHPQLPQTLQERVRRFVQYKWLTTREVDEESILSALPTDLRRDIQRHLCLDLVRPDAVDHKQACSSFFR